MKRSVVTFATVVTTLSLSFLLSCNSQSGAGKNGTTAAPSPGDTASIWFTEYEHDFGKVTAGEKVVNLFTYENRGTIPLVIYAASTSCGCTVSKYSTKPLRPGKKDTMEVTFDTSGRNGRQTKTITVRSNATRQIVLLRITCDVVTVNNN